MKYRAEIDGLRALAVVPVILFHAGFELFSGGFVGVDVFFVISGYLITTILIEDIENKRFSIINFYERRARRILPALFFVMLVCIPFAWMWMLPNQMKDFSASIFSVSVFLSNLYFMSQLDYFAASAELSPLLHTWSLSVEEQFYLFFPPLLLILFKKSQRLALFGIIFICVVSFLFSEWASRENPERNFFFTASRIWELLAGSITAFVVQKKGAQRNNLLSNIGFAAIIFSIFFYDETTPFPSVYALVPVLGVVLLLLYADKETLAAKLLSTKAFVGVGLISYSAYLWHQPLFAFARIRVFEPSDKLFIALSVISFLLAYLSWHYIEVPFRRRKLMKKSKIMLLSFSVVLLSLFGVAGILGYITNGFEASSKSRLILTSLAERTATNHGISSTCEGEFTLSDDCATSSMPAVLLWGDSFAMHLYQGLNASADTIKLRQITKSSCSPILGISHANEGFDPAYKCIDFNNSVYEWLKNNKSVQFVVLSSPFGWVNNKIAITSDGKIIKSDVEFVLSMFKKTVQKIESLGVGVIVVSPTPVSGNDIGRCLAHKYRFNPQIDCDFKYSKSIYLSDFMKKVSNFSGVYWLNNDICKKGICSSETQGVYIYRDAGHLSKEGSAFLGKKNDWYDVFKKTALGE